jgi:hypothetical protein
MESGKRGDTTKVNRNSLTVISEDTPQPLAMNSPHPFYSGSWFVVLLVCILVFVLPGEWALFGAEGDPTPTRSKSVFGINADPVWDFNGSESSGDNLAEFTRMLKQCHCGSVRIPLRWRVIEPKKGEWDFSAIDRAIDAIPRQIEIVATLMSVPAWPNGATPENAKGWFDSYPPKDLRDWQQAVSRIVNRYRHRIKHWEVWNEENGIDFFRPQPDAKAYTELLKVTYGAAKAADPECLVVLGGLQMNGIIANPWSEWKVTGFLEDLYKAGAEPFFDVCNIHPYASPKEGAGHMMNLTRDTFSLMARYGDTSKPLWITEVGCGANSSQAEEEQAHLLADTYTLAGAEPRIDRVFWFLLRDMKKDLLGPESSMGLFKVNGEHRPALKSFQAVTGQ